MMKKRKIVTSAVQVATGANVDRRRVITGIGAVAATSWLSTGIAQQRSVHETDILVIGGGMAGSATALQLARHGRSVTLVERGQIASEASGQNMADWAEPGGATCRTCSPT